MEVSSEQSENVWDLMEVMLFGMLMEVSAEQSENAEYPM